MAARGGQMARNAALQWARSSALWVSFCIVFWPTPADASYANADARCQRPAASSDDSNASRALEALAARIEAHTRTPYAPPSSESLAQIANDVDPNADVSQEALAAFCTAAGEAARNDREGGAAQAVRLLSLGFMTAQAARHDQLIALSAYRLGLASISLRGEGGAGSRAGVQDAVSVDQTARDDHSEACAALRSAIDEQEINAALALECAAMQAAQTHQTDLAARSQLRLARLRLAGAVSPPSPRVGAILRELAASAAVSGLRTALADPASVDVVLLGRLAEAALEAGSGDPAVANAIAAMSERAGNNRSIEAQAAALGARLDLIQGARDRAIAGLRRAIFLESQTSAPLRLPDLYMLLGDADPANRAQHVLAAYRALENVRPLMPLRDPLTEESVFSLSMRPVFEAALEYDLPVQRSGAPSGSIDAAQRVLEAFRQAEIESVFGNDCVPPLRPIALGDLRENEIVLYPVLLGDRLELIYASGRNRMGYQRVSVSLSLEGAEVARLVRAMTASMATSALRDDWQSASRRLYELLILPIERELAGEDTVLIIVPDGALRSIPFAALQDASGQYLIQRARITIAPSLAYAQPGRDMAGRRASVVSASMERTVTVSSLTFPALPNAGAEATAAAGENETVLHNFTPAQLEQALDRGGVDILHLATHASFEGRTDRSFIVAQGAGAGGEAIPLTELRRMIALGRTRGDELELLVLSACETAVGDDQASMGLAGAAVQAGARSAIASLWQVRDESTAQLMTAFYRHYRNGSSKSEALRQAQLELIQNGDYRHPHHWAAFILIGGWR